MLARPTVPPGCAGMLALAAPASSQATFVVDDDAPGPGSGSFADPFPTIQQGVDAASDGDIVVVLAGVYDAFDVVGKGVTVRSRFGAEATVVEIGGAGDEIRFDGTPTGAALLGLTFDRSGGPGRPLVEVVSGTLEVADSRFVDGFASPSGGGLCVSGSTVTVRGSEFVGCRAQNDGGGIFVDAMSSAVIEDCRFEGCTCFIGSGVAVQGAADVRRRVFESNVALIGPGGAFAGLVEDCVFRWNEVQDNFADSGIVAGSALFRSCVVSNNIGLWFGAAISPAYLNGYHGAPAIESCTLEPPIGIFASPTYAVHALFGPTIAVRNSILYDSLGGSVAISGADLEYSLVSSQLVSGTGNLTGDPGLLLPETDVAQLSSSSQCIDAGDPAQTDLDGSRIDIGAHPFDPAFRPVPSPSCIGRPFVSGLHGRLSGAQLPSLTQGFPLSATNLEPNRTALLVVGTGAATNLVSCVGGTITRLVPLSTGPGSTTFDVAGAELAAVGFQPGDRLFATLYVRDTASLFNFAITTGLEAIVVP